MAKPLRLQFGETELAFELTKVDRSKLYGSKEIEVLDEDGQKCELATLAGDGRTLVGRGGTGMGYLSPDGTWCDRGDLKPVDLEGRPMPEMASTFDEVVPLTERVTPAEYLDYNVRSVYLLSSGDDLSAIRAELARGDIFKFRYSFRRGVESDFGFLLAGQKDQLFLAVGTHAPPTMVGLQEAAVAAPEPDTDDEEDGDLMDFGMI